MADTCRAPGLLPIAGTHCLWPGTNAARPADQGRPGSVTQRKELLPVLGGGAGTAAHRPRALGWLLHRVDGYPARALQHQPGGLGLPARRAEPVLAVRVLEAQE